MIRNEELFERAVAEAFDRYVTFGIQNRESVLPRVRASLTLGSGRAAGADLANALGSTRGIVVLASGRLQSSSRWRNRFRLGMPLVAVVATLVLGLVAYAVAPLISQLLAAEQGVAALPMQAIGQTQTIRGVTVRVDRAYADVNRILVAYTIEVPAGFANSTSGIDGMISLTDDQGAMFPLEDAYGVGNTSQGSAGFASFDAESIAPGTKVVKLQLTLPDVRAKAKDRSIGDLTAGAFAFAFQLPVVQGRTVNVGRTVVAKGVPVTLERVVVTPSESRVYLRFPARPGISDDWMVNAYLSGAGWDSRQIPAGFRGEMTLGSTFVNSRGEHVTTFSGDFGGRRGQWVLTVNSLEGVQSVAAVPGSALKQVRIEGQWTFKFSLP